MTLQQWPAPKEEIHYSESPDDPVQIPEGHCPGCLKISECLIAILRRKRIFLTFAKYCKENDDEHITVTEQTKKLMNTSRKLVERRKLVMLFSIEKKIEDRFGDKKIFNNMEGTANVVTWSFTAFSILHDNYQLSCNGMLVVNKNKENYPNCLCQCTRFFIECPTT